MATRSPFPGMDPYLEARWPSVHARLATYAADDLNTRLPPGLAADVEERTEIVPDDERATWRRPDVAVSDDLGGPVAVAPRLSVDAPLVLTLLDPEPATERSVRIVSDEDDRIVTAIELVSPSNKKVPGLDDFRRKRRALLEGGASVVEVDLTRGGNWRRLIGQFEVIDEADTAYRVAVRLPDEPNRVYLTPVGLRDRLPEVAIPLRPGDPRVTLDLQALLDRVYDAASYGRRVDYSRPPRPALPAAHAQWAADRIARSEVVRR